MLAVAGVVRARAAARGGRAVVAGGAGGVVAAVGEVDIDVDRTKK